jgi:hypothetical protein
MDSKKGWKIQELDFVIKKKEENKLTNLPRLEWNAAIRNMKSE